MEQHWQDTVLSNETNETRVEVKGHDPGSWAESLESVYWSLGPGFFWTMFVTGSLGIAGNILSFLVYARLGFSPTINISYSALVVSDLLCVHCGIVFGYSFLAAPLPNLSQELSQEVLKLVGAYPYVAFSRVTGLLTAWISLERCLCVIFPTKVKRIISRHVTSGVICVIYMLGCLPLVLLYVTHHEMETHQPSSKSDVSTPSVPQHPGPVQSKLETTAVFLCGIVYPTLSYITVAVCTAALIATLCKAARWRRLNATPGIRSASANQNTQLATRDLRVIRVVVIVAVVFLICSAPTTAQLLATFIVDGYTNKGYLRSLRRINGMVVVLFACINSSLNLIIFTASGQKFRSALLQILSLLVCRRLPPNSAK